MHQLCESGLQAAVPRVSRIGAIHVKVAVSLFVWRWPKQIPAACVSDGAPASPDPPLHPAAHPAPALLASPPSRRAGCQMEEILRGSISVFRHSQKCFFGITSSECLADNHVISIATIVTRDASDHSVRVESG
ncbi:hypothetical protein H920_18927 [Fukomys damarensis]|uniref:Uncharacterized protein n=1 Tax=Fukomys damarensis TaxID=885580 RepID=A0A091D9W9_FUKDA|nr:hypothetical protein H920_18927 [Fukomys damarensis]